MIFIYTFAIGCIFVIIKSITDKVAHTKRVNAGHKAYKTRIHNIRYIPVNLSGHKYNIKRGK